MNTPEDCKESEIKCSCGLTAKLRVSKTRENPVRLFYNCPRGFSNQCEFFRWSDEPAPTGDAHTDEVNLIRNECIRLQEKLDNERAAWTWEKSKLKSNLLRVQAELDDLKKIKIKIKRESDFMPPVYGTPDAGDDTSNAVELHVELVNPNFD